MNQSSSANEKKISSPDSSEVFDASPSKTYHEQAYIDQTLRLREILKTLPAFTKEEGRSYVLDKLQRAGATRAIFEDAALEAILNASDGTPRIINNLCNSCLLIGDSRKSDMITAEIVMQAINNNEI